MIFPQDRREEWNQFVAASPYGDVLQCWEWAELKARSGWQPLPVAVTDGTGIAAACMLLKRSIPVVGGCLLYAPRGPIVDFADEPVWIRLLDELRQVANEHRAFALKIDPAVPSDQQQVVARLEQAGFQRRAPQGEVGWVRAPFVMEVDIAPPLDELLMRFNRGTRRNIRLAERKGVAVSSECSRHEISAFYDMLRSTGQRAGFAIHDISYFYDLWDSIIQAGLGRMFLAYVDGEPVAGTIAFVLGHGAWSVYSASNDGHRNLKPNNLLQWRMIQWAKECGCSVYNMGGVGREVDGEARGKLSGLNRFKRGFAAEYVEYVGEWDLVFRPTYHRLFDTIYEISAQLGRPLSRLRVKRK